MTAEREPTTIRENPYQLLLSVAPLTEAEERLLAHVQSGKANPGVRPEVLRACAVILSAPRQEPTPQPDRAPPIEAESVAVA